MQVDLNLLIALDALVEHKSVQGAAAAVHLTPPAMSHTLRRLRAATGDDVLVRNGRHMAPTARAVAMQEEVRDILSRAYGVLSPPPALDLARLDRTFTIRGNDALVAALAPALLHEITETAPDVSIVFLGEDSVDGPDLARGTADIVIGGGKPDSPAVHFAAVGEDHLVVVMRRDHPLASGKSVSIQQFASAGHVVTSRRGRLHGAIDDALADHGLRRRVVASLPSTAIALEVVQRSDMVTVVAEHLTRHSELVVSRAVPLELPAMAALISWHRRHDSDPAHRWLRERISAHLTDALR